MEKNAYLFDNIKAPDHIEVRGARANNLKNVDVDIPLNQFVAVCGVSGSGKSTLSTDVLYAEGSRRYLEALSTYTRRRIGQAARPDVDKVRYLPSALALHQRPTVPSVRSTVGTMSEILNILRLSFSRLGSHVCPNGHRIRPTLGIAQTGKLTCPECGVTFDALSAEDFAFNASGACPTCHGTGEVRQIDEKTLIGNPAKTIREGAVIAWKATGSNLYPLAAESRGIPLDVPYRELTEEQKQTVLHGESFKVPVVVYGKGGRKVTLDVTYLNAQDAVEHAYQNTDSEKALEKLNQFYHIGRCPACHGSRFAPHLLKSMLGGRNIAEVSGLTLGELAEFAKAVPDTLPEEMVPLARRLMDELGNSLRPLLLLGLEYLTLDRAGYTLSTGELQRIQLARTLKNETTGVLYVLDEPSIGLHPVNVEGLFDVLMGLLQQGNSLVVVDHDTDILKKAGWMIEMGPGAGKLGGTVISQGTVADVEQSSSSVIAPYLTGKAPLVVRQKNTKPARKYMKLKVDRLYTLHDVSVSIPVGKLTAVTGVSGSGKTTLILDCLVPGMEAAAKKKMLPEQILELDPAGIKRIVTVDAVPVGKNIRSTVATYSGIFDEVRELFAGTDEAKLRDFDAGYFSYNRKEGACPTCGGTGQISLDIQYLPDMDITCPDCGGKRYTEEVLAVKWNGYSIYDILKLSVDEALEVFAEYPAIASKLSALSGLGLGYLTLGEDTPKLSGGEAQRLKLVSEIGHKQSGSLFVFDEPTTGLHPQDIRTLIHVFDTLLEAGATVIAIEHDLDLIANADYVLDMGPKGGSGGGKVVADGTPEEICKHDESLTGQALRRYAHDYGMDW